jgi:hypothetical protein
METSEKDIFGEILKKIYIFGIQNYNKHPNRLYISRDQYIEILKHAHFRNYVQMDWIGGKPKTIFGIQYEITENQHEIKVE